MVTYTPSIFRACNQSNKPFGHSIIQKSRKTWSVEVPKTFHAEPKAANSTTLEPSLFKVFVRQLQQLQQHQQPHGTNAYHCTCTVLWVTDCALLLARKQCCCLMHYRYSEVTHLFHRVFTELLIVLMKTLFLDPLHHWQAVVWRRSTRSGRLWHVPWRRQGWRCLGWRDNHGSTSWWLPVGEQKYLSVCF